MENTIMRDPYDDQLRAARYRAERDQAREELDRAGRRIRGLESALQEARCTRAEDREAGEWVRGHGGLDAVEKQWGLREDVIGIVGEALWGTPDRMPDDLDDDELRAELLSRLMPAGYEWDDRLSGAVDFFESMHDLLYTVDCEDDHDGPEMVQEVMRRLMPEGLEWPRYESGELVRSGYRLFDDNGDRFRAVSFIFTYDWWCIEGYQQIGFGTLSRETKRKLSGMPYGERVERPAPKVLDADGVEIRVGDVLYSIETGDSVTVDSIEPGNPWFATTDGTLQHCAKLTHRRSVLDADGVPIHVGDTVYANGDARGDGTAWRVLRIEPAISYPLCCEREDGKPGGARVLKPEWVTHERPDSWERLEEDADKFPCEYFGIDNGASCGQCPAYLKESPNGGRAIGCRFEQKRDLVRRAKALAERGQ
ncbi:hypothetical protein H6A08_09365 [Enorma massiliensis]|uniref:hypothetical protein n=1 Tax=Enorma massiliensis TaxID=1472761 RepID=UPI001957DD16|nr:hypothetical protein [Enorma massiliensis]MBM6784558.1 hypothetical protein [Enorma massiliensis]